ncbi:MAG: hypothetical protein ACOC8O_01265 [Natronomonas sp.]
MSAEPQPPTDLAPDGPTEQPEPDRVDRMQRNMNRRRFMQTTAAVGATALAVGAGAGVSLAASNLDYDSDFVQNPYMTGSVTVRTHRHDFEELDYDPDGSVDHASLKDMGVRIAEQDEDDAEDDVPYNPVTLDAANFRVEAVEIFPREEEYENSDGDDVPLNWIDGEEHWSTDESETDGSISVTDDSDGVEFAFTHGSDTDAATATFDDFNLDSGLGQNYFQAIFDVTELAADAVIDVVVRDSQDNTVTLTIDPDADAADDDVLANETVDSKVVQTQFADLDGIDDMENFDELELQMHSGDATVKFYGLDLENPSRWDFGMEEYTDSDDNLDTQTVYEPEGEYSITSIDTVGMPMEEGDTIEDVEYQIEYFAGYGPSEMVDWEIVDADRQASGDYTRRFRAVYNLEPEPDFELIWSLDDLLDVNRHGSSAWLEAGFETGLDDPADLEDYDDDDLSLTSRTTEYGDASIDDEVELSTTASSGEVTAVFVDHLVRESDEEEMTESEAAVGPTDSSGGGGFVDMILSVPGMIITGGGLAVAYAYGLIPGLGGN